MGIKETVYFSPLGILIHCLTVLLKCIGCRCIVYGFYNRRQKKYYKKTRIASTCIIMSRKDIDIEDNVWINHYTWLDASGGLKIGEGCQIGFSCAILSHSSHISIRLLGKDYMKYPIHQRAGYIHKPVVIGKYSFIGSGSYILPGVTIGKGCLIGVNSVVTKDIPDYSVAIGSPARIIGDTRDQDRVFLQEGRISESYYDW